MLKIGLATISDLLLIFERRKSRAIRYPKVLQVQRPRFIQCSCNQRYFTVKQVLFHETFRIHRRRIFCVVCHVENINAEESSKETSR